MGGSEGEDSADGANIVPRAMRGVGNGINGKVSKRQRNSQQCYPLSLCKSSTENVSETVPVRQRLLQEKNCS